MTIGSKWRRIIAWLRGNYPPHLPVRVRSVSDKAIGGLHGQCDFNEDDARFLILVNRQKCYNLRVDTLLHEWAHALTWFGAETHEDDHSAEWGVAYAKLYRALMARQHRDE